MKILIKCFIYVSCHTNLHEVIEKQEEIKMVSVFKDLKWALGMYAGALALGALLTRGCNCAWNNREISKPSHQTISYSTGITGHVEYTRYDDGTRDVKIYPGLSHRLFDSELYQDLDGDGLVERIRRNGAEWKMNRLNKLLVREHDYAEHKEEFDEADQKLQELIEKYDK